MPSNSRSQFELHAVADAANETDSTSFVARDYALPVANMLPVADGEPMWVNFDEKVRIPVRVNSPEDALFGVLAVQRKVARELALVPMRGTVLVNSNPALGVTLLSTQDSIIAGHDSLLYVTQRFNPHVGPPTEEMLSARLKCPFCKLTVTPETCVVSCRCGAVYNHETEASHSHLSPEDRLNCVAKINTCLACGQLVSLEESLVWDPVTL